MYGSSGKESLKRLRAAIRLSCLKRFCVRQSVSQPEAWAIGKRIINVIGSSGTIGAKLKALRKRGKATAPQVAALLNAESTLNLEPPPRKRAAPSVLPPPPAPPPPSAPPPLAGTRTASAALI